MLVFESINEFDLSNDLDWWKLYKASFPESEREPKEAITKSLRTNTGLAFRLSLNSHTKGIATVHLLKNPDIVFLVYLAISAEVQGQKYGAAFFNYVYETSRLAIESKGRPFEGMVWEVENTKLALDNLAERERRIRFFTKRGAFILDCNYTQPPLNGNSIEMHLMFKHEKPSLNISMQELLHAIYFQKYGENNEIDLKILETLYRKSINL